MLVIKVKRSVTKNKWQFEQVLSFFGTYISISQWTINVLHNFFVLPPPPPKSYLQVAEELSTMAVNCRHDLYPPDNPV